MNKYIVVEPGNIWEEVMYNKIKAIKVVLETQDEFKTIIIKAYKDKIVYRAFITDLFKSYLKIGRTWYYYDNYRLKRVDKLTQLLLK